MAEGKKSFIAYSDWKETFDALPDEKAGQLIKHIFKYVNDEDPQSDDILINAVFPNIRNALKRDLKKWEKQHQQRIKAGQKSAEIRKRNAASVNDRSTTVQHSSTDSVNVSVSDNVTVNDIEKRKESFKKKIKEFSHSYSIDELKTFFNYWSEHNEPVTKSTKMRFELKKNQPFNIKTRLVRFRDTEKKPEKKGPADNKRVPSDDEYEQLRKEFQNGTS